MRAPTPGRWSRHGRALRICLLVALALLIASCAPDAPQDTFDPAGPVAERQLDLWNIVFPIAVGVFVLVQGILLLAVWRFRRRGDDDGELPKQVAGNTRLEILWTLIPAVILAGISVPTVATIFSLSQEPEDALQVRVVAKQYWWEFEYLDGEGEGVVTAGQLHIPTERPVFLTMESLSATVPDPGGVGESVSTPAAAGVVHSFWVPRLAGKQDVFPGDVRHLTLEADEPGRYEGQCAEFCGLSHSRMRFQVVAQEQGEFEDWLAAQAEPVEMGQREGLAAQGEELFETADCVACHAIRGYETSDGQPAETRTAPDLTHFASRDRFAGAVLETNEENLTEWLRNPPGVKPGAQMPNLGLSDEEIEALVAYLQSLE